MPTSVTREHMARSSEAQTIENRKSPSRLTLSNMRLGTREPGNTKNRKDRFNTRYTEPAQEWMSFWILPSIDEK